jgi:hypothetical protein
MDSGAFTEVSKFGGYRRSVREYAREANRWDGCGTMMAIVSQDYMCEPFILKKTGMTVREHQQLTIDRYLRLIEYDLPAPVMPVIQGYTKDDYLFHLDQYDDLLEPGQWVGIGSVCKRNSKPEQVHQILKSIKDERPDIRLHGFGLKYTALGHRPIIRLLHSSDSMAWSFAARYEGRNQNDWREAKRYVAKVENFIS